MRDKPDCFVEINTCLHPKLFPAGTEGHSCVSRHGPPRASSAGISWRIFWLNALAKRHKSLSSHEADLPFPGFLYVSGHDGILILWGHRRIPACFELVKHVACEFLREAFTRMNSAGGPGREDSSQPRRRPPGTQDRPCAHRARGGLRVSGQESALCRPRM